MRHDQQRGLSRIGILRDFACTFEQQFGHERMVPNRLAIFPTLAARSFCYATIQLKLARDYGLGEITFADKIRHDINFANRFGIEQEDRVAQTRFLFPKRAADLDKDFSTPNFHRVRQRRRARIRIHRRAVSDNEKGGVGS